ncbi:MAG: tetratricopeptide repeat protein [Nitrospirota bacterium]
MFTRRNIMMGVVVLLAALLATACGGPEVKKAKFFNKGKALYEKGDYVKARLEFKNAIQIDLKYADAYYMLGMIALKTGDPRSAYGIFQKVIELSPKHAGAHVQIGWFFLAAGRPDEAMREADPVMKDDAAYEDALLLKAAVLVKKKDIEGACRFLESSLGRDIRKADGYLMLASLYEQTGNVQQAEKVLLDGVKAEEKSVSLHLALAKLYLKDKRTDDATGMMRKVIDIDPDRAQHRLTLAAIYWGTGKEQEAGDVLKAFLSADPKKEERWIQTAEFYLSRKRTSDAEQQLKEGIRQNPKTFQIRFALSALYLNTNRANEGLSLLQECVGLESNQGNPNVIYAKNTLARYYLSRQEFDKSRQLIGEVLKKSPKNIIANYIKGTIHLMNHESLQAVAAFRSVVGENPDSIPGMIGLAEAHAQNNELNLAFDTIQNALKNAPGSRDLHRAKARLLVKKKNFKEAESQYRGILAKYPDDLDVRADLGDLLMVIGDINRAEEEYVSIKRRAPKHPISYVRLSALYGVQKKWQKSVRKLEDAVKIQPESWSLNNDLAYLLTEYGDGKRDLERALTFAEKAQTLNPENANVLDTLGWINYRKGDVSKAIDWLEKALAKNASDPEFNYHLGMANYTAGNIGKAKECLHTAVTSTVGFPEKAVAQKVLAGIH